MKRLEERDVAQIPSLVEMAMCRDGINIDLLLPFRHPSSTQPPPPLPTHLHPPLPTSTHHSLLKPPQHLSNISDIKVNNCLVNRPKLDQTAA
ncbi:hypothetical protein Pcinc_039535 [Petrolisthes cinctipes]|uniref:Uncharacterized protein n=1 Tax=Petrolisthes cinctipes TaxID=88211 RepID=A0AAE1EIZ8_PETCI|nr:hypothetical protein Pcinc_039535 [Petrolisthes cinctipes]